MSSENILQKYKPDPKGHTLYDSTHKKYLEQAYETK